MSRPRRNTAPLPCRVGGPCWASGRRCYATTPARSGAVSARRGWRGHLRGSWRAEHPDCLERVLRPVGRYGSRAMLPTAHGGQPGSQTGGTGGTGKTGWTQGTSGWTSGVARGRLPVTAAGRRYSSDGFGGKIPAGRYVWLGGWRVQGPRSPPTPRWGSI